MNIEHKIREFLRTQDDPVTVQQIGEAIGHENSNSLGTILYKMANHNQGVGRKKIKEGKRLLYGYFSTDKDAPATSKTTETLNLASKPVEKQEVKQIAEAAPEPKDIPPVIPESNIRQNLRQTIQERTSRRNSTSWATAISLRSAMR